MKTFTSKKSAEEVRRKMRAYKNDPLNYSGASVSKADAARYFRKWADEYKKPRIKVGSYDRLDSVLRLYVEPELENIQLGDVTPDDCNDIINKYHDRGLSFSTVKKIYDALHSCFTFAEERHDVRESPMRTVKMLPKATFTTKQKDSEDARHLTEDEEAVFLA